MRAAPLLLTAMLAASCGGVDSTPVATTEAPETTVPVTAATTPPPATDPVPTTDGSPGSGDVVIVEVDGSVFALPVEACRDDAASRATVRRYHDAAVDELMSRLASVRSGWPTTTVPFEQDESFGQLAMRLGPPIFAMALLLGIDNETAVEMATRERSLGSARYPVPAEVAEQILGWLAIGSEIVDGLPAACGDV